MAIDPRTGAQARDQIIGTGGIFPRKALKAPQRLMAAEQAIFKYFQYDIQALSDTFPIKPRASRLGGMRCAAGVSSEVKQVANRTARATAAIGAIISKINEIADNIAPVKEPAASGNECGRRATKATGDVIDTQRASLELSRMAARLQTVVSHFTF